LARQEEKKRRTKVKGELRGEEGGELGEQEGLETKKRWCKGGSGGREERGRKARQNQRGGKGLKQ